jgi:hypothetical protein
MKLGIIGTAGRGYDKNQLTKGMFASMCHGACIVINENKIDHVISGGAAWADHVAVHLFLGGAIPNLTLHLPCEFRNGAYWGNRTAEIANFYHYSFSDVMGFKSLSQIEEAIKRGANITVSKGFFVRNTLVADESDVMLAMTFGNKETLKDGGTADTMGKFLVRGGKAYHVDLHTGNMYPTAKVN